MRELHKLLAVLSLLGIVLLGGGNLFAQNRACQGTVTDAQGEPLISASVLIKDAPVYGADVEKYINLVRERGFGSNWNKSQYGYTAGSFTENELAILAEKDKEMIMEGQRWWDVRRMTLTKDGKHLVFCKEGNPANDRRLLIL